MIIKNRKTLISITIASFMFIGCGETKDGSSNSGEPTKGAHKEADANFKEVAPSVEITATADKTEDGGTLDGKYGTTVDNMRLLKPSELDRKTKEVFGSEWMVEVAGTDSANPDALVQQNGFKAFASNLNGIDYDSLNDYSETVTAIFMSTHEKFCRDMSTSAFADPTKKANFFEITAEADTLATNESGIKENLRQIAIKMFGDDISQDSDKWDLVLGLYEALEGANAQARANKHPLELTVHALCFTSPFVHTY